jgi:nickel/cobalt transporter (NicO) family protein
MMRTLLALLLTLVATPALAHPHIFIDARATIVFNDAGEITGIRNSWTFDEAFSVWQTQGLDTNGDGITSPEEMQELADENMSGLAEYGFYTSAGEKDETLPMAAMDDARFVYENGRSTLSFGIEPQAPYRIRDALEIAISDPEYYVAITFADVSDVTLENAPQGCGVRLEPPKDMSEEILSQLYALPPDVTQLPPELAAAMRGAQGAIVVSCPTVAEAMVPATALEAVATVAQASPTPFGGPPPEPGFTMPRTGFLGWIAEQQQQFYQALTAALGALKEDNNAFLLLGTLSFLYGVFHAAGPGHGKVVISSYVLANEQQVRRGILLSFLSAMLQAAVAIGLVLIAAGALHLTAAAMNEAANWIGIVSYALVALLGLWLIGRKLFGRRHEHAPAQVHGHDHHEHHHHDEHDHHVVTAQATHGGWREQLGVVLAVGLRPCSGALIVLAFALSQDVLLAGIVAVILMALGTALTVAVLASLAVGLKGFAYSAAGGGTLAAGLVWWAEFMGAVLVFGFGAVLLLASI